MFKLDDTMIDLATAMGQAKDAIERSQRALSALVEITHKIRAHNERLERILFELETSDNISESLEIAVKEVEVDNAEHA